MKILKDHGKNPDILVVIIFCNVYAIEPYLPLGRFIQTAQELNQRRLSRAVLPHKGELLPDVKGHGDVL